MQISLSRQHLLLLRTELNRSQSSNIFHDPAGPSSPAGDSSDLFRFATGPEKGSERGTVGGGGQLAGWLAQRRSKSTVNFFRCRQRMQNPPESANR